MGSQLSVISITAGPAEHLSVSVAQEAAHLASDGQAGSQLPNRRLL